MKPNIIHSMVVCLAAFILPFMVACGSQEESLPDDVAEAVFYLNIEPIGQTRANAAELPDNEKLKTSVRVVILHPDRTVEHNRRFPLDNALSRQYIWLKVKPGEKKKIFLFANEESVRAVTTAAGGVSGYPSLTDFFDSYTEGMNGFEDAVNGLSFTPDYTGGKPIPMSSMYEIEFPEKGNLEETFYVVRAATKFTVNFYNWRGEDVTVKNLSIASHADRNFLMAHVNSYPDTQNPETNQKYPTWIDWLKAVSDASNVDSDKATEDFGWLTDYELPAGEGSTSVYEHGEVIVNGATMDKENPGKSEPGKATIVPVFYLPESKNLKAGESTDGEQEYTLTLNIDGREEPFVCKLGKLKALFRNTHVVVNVTLYHNLEATVEVIPFTDVPLNPDYGLEREEFTGYVAGKDEKGNPCWYDGNYYDSNFETAVPYYLGPTGHEGGFVTINGKEYLLVYADYERTAAKLEYFFEKETRKKYLLDAAGRTGYSFTIHPENPEWGIDIYYNKLQQRVWLSEDYNEWTVGENGAWYWQTGTTWYRTLNEWDRLNWNQAIYWHWTDVYPKYWFDILGNRYLWSEGDTKDKRRAKLVEKIGEDWIKYLE